jgi:hypothetical protein
VFFADIMDKDDGFLDKAIEGLVLFPPRATSSMRSLEYMRTIEVKP